jgi:hypothetical protein
MKIRGAFSNLSIDIDNVGAAIGWQKWLMAASELASKLSGDYHALTCKHGSNCCACHTQTPATTSRFAAAISGFPITREAHSSQVVFPNFERRRLTQWPSTSLAETIRAVERRL